MTWDFKGGILGGIFIKQNPFSEFCLFRRNFEIPKTTTTRPDHLDFSRIHLLESLNPREREREGEALKSSIIFFRLEMLMCFAAIMTMEKKIGMLWKSSPKLYRTFQSSAFES